MSQGTLDLFQRPRLITTPDQRRAAMRSVREQIAGLPEVYPEFDAVQGIIVNTEVERERSRLYDELDRLRKMRLGSLA